MTTEQTKNDALKDAKPLAKKPTQFIPNTYGAKGRGNKKGGMSLKGGKHSNMSKFRGSGGDR